MQTLRLLLQMVLGIALPLALQLLDHRRLSAEQRARSWNGATWGAALYAFGPLSMLGWCWVTRGAHSDVLSDPRVGRGKRIRTAVGLGVASVATLVGVLLAVDYLVALALDLP